MSNGEGDGWYHSTKKQSSPEGRSAALDLIDPASAFYLTESFSYSYFLLVSPNVHRPATSLYERSTYFFHEPSISTSFTSQTPIWRQRSSNQNSSYPIVVRRFSEKQPWAYVFVDSSSQAHARANVLEARSSSRSCCSPCNCSIDRASHWDVDQMV